MCDSNQTKIFFKLNLRDSSYYAPQEISVGPEEGVVADFRGYYCRGLTTPISPSYQPAIMLKSSGGVSSINNLRALDRLPPGAHSDRARLTTHAAETRPTRRRDSAFFQKEKKRCQL